MSVFHTSRGKLSLYTFALIFFTFNRPSVCTILHVREGEEAKLYFSYPCDSTKTTLQHSYKLPFYNSENADANPLPPRYGLENLEKNDDDPTCSILLIIDPVSRNDVGTYILSVYNHSQLLPEYPRIGLRVGYPPGQVSCESSGNYPLDETWIKLKCIAPSGNLAGRIVCYQDSVRLPPLRIPVENGERLSQIILARIANHSVRCCSYTFDQIKTMQQCRDCGWDPIQNIALTDLTDPSTTVLPTQHSKSTKNFTYEGKTPSSCPQMITDMANNKDVHSKTPLYIVIGFMGLIIVILIVYCTVLRLRKTRSLTRGLIPTIFKR